MTEGLEWFMLEPHHSLVIAHSFNGSALDSIHQNHLGREGLRWNDGQLMTCYTK